MTQEQKDDLLKVRGSAIFNATRKPFESDVNIQQSELLNIVYAVNPKTGFPSSDLEVQENPNTPIAVRSALEKYNRPINTRSPSSLDDDEVLDGMQYLHETDDEYSNRMRGAFSKKDDT